MNGWAGFWIMVAVVTATDLVVEYLRWRIKVLYSIKDKRTFWQKVFSND